MTFKLKEWIAHVNTTLELLKYIKAIEEITISDSSTGDITLDNLERVFVIGSGAGNSKIIAVASATSAGAVSSLKVAGATNMTLTNGTNKLTISNGYNYSMKVLIIKF